VAPEAVRLPFTYAADTAEALAAYEPSAEFPATLDLRR
jgi:hypothetical protein